MLLVRAKYPVTLRPSTSTNQAHIISLQWWEKEKLDNSTSPETNGIGENLKRDP
jgi:hypothetical protein